MDGLSIEHLHLSHFCGKSQGKKMPLEIYSSFIAYMLSIWKIDII